MTGLKILALAPFGITVPILASSPNPSPGYLQYGALGLCAIIVVFLCGFIRQLIDKLDRKDQTLADLYKKNTDAFNRLADLLEDRPCLNNDHRIKGSKK